jgi:hypothetical protein
MILNKEKYGNLGLLITLSERKFVLFKTTCNQKATGYVIVFVDI